MCLFVKDFDNSHNPVILTATRKKVVYKRFIGGRLDNVLESPYRGFPYERGSIYEANFELVDGYKIEEGIHAYTCRKAAKRGTWGFHDEIVIKCIIPKGAKYIIGLRDEIVATQLYIPKLTRLDRLRAWFKKFLEDIDD